MPISTYLANKWLDTLRNVSFGVATLYASLHMDDPGDTGANEVSGGSYARRSVTLAAAANKGTSNSAMLEWTNMPAVTVSYVGLWDAATGGNFLWGGQLAQAKTLYAGDTFRIAVGDLDITQS